MTPERSKASAADYDVCEDRAYGSYAEMFEKERALPEGERIDYVSVATPNHMHFPVAKAAVEAGFHVVCDKPLTLTLAEAEELAEVVKNSKHRSSLSPTTTPAIRWCGRPGR